MDCAKRRNSGGTVAAISGADARGGTSAVAADGGSVMSDGGSVMSRTTGSVSAAALPAVAMAAGGEWEGGGRHCRVSEDKMPSDAM